LREKFPDAVVTENPAEIFMDEKRNLDEFVVKQV